MHIARLLCSCATRFNPCQAGHVLACISSAYVTNMSCHTCTLLCGGQGNMQCQTCMFTAWTQDACLLLCCTLVFILDAAVVNTHTSLYAWSCRHFAEAPAPCGNMCDNCLRGHAVQHMDASAAAAGLLTTLHNVAAADKRLTLSQLIDAARKAQVTCP